MSRDKRDQPAGHPQRARVCLSACDWCTPTARAENANGRKRQTVRDRILARIAMRLLDRMSSEPKDRVLAAFKRAVHDEHYLSVKLPGDPVETRYAKLADGLHAAARDQECDCETVV